MAFERFTAKGKSFVPKVSIWKRGQMGLSQGAVERFRLSEYKYVALFYDRDNNMIGLKFTNDEKEEGIAKLSVKANGAIFSAKAFLDFYDIDYTDTKQYDIKLDVESGLYIFDLKKGE